MRAVDANVLVRLVVRDDSGQVEAAEQFISAGALVPLLALTEAAWVLTSAYHLTPQALITVVEMLLDHESLVLQESELVAAALKLFRAKPALGFSDCLILQSARKAGHLPMGTFDRNLARIEGATKL
jgi:predicted nucleic-acid-binding protein